MKIKSISDVVTNSSSETWCIVTSNDGRLKEIYETLKPFGFEDECGDGGVYLRKNSVEISLSYSSYSCGLAEIAALGLKEILKDFDCNIEMVDDGY